MTEEQFQEYMNLLKSFVDVNESLENRWKVQPTDEQRQKTADAIVRFWNFYKADVERLLNQQ